MASSRERSQPGNAAAAIVGATVDANGAEVSQRSEPSGPSPGGGAAPGAGAGVLVAGPWGVDGDADCPWGACAGGTPGAAGDAVDDGEGDVEGVGEVVAPTVRETAGLALLVLPTASVCRAETTNVPAGSAGLVQAQEAPLTVAVQARIEPDVFVRTYTETDAPSSPVPANAIPESPAWVAPLGGEVTTGAAGASASTCSDTVALGSEDERANDDFWVALTLYVPL
jgi:hypothetical protein